MPPHRGHTRQAARTCYYSGDTSTTLIVSHRSALNSDIGSKAAPSKSLQVKTVRGKPPQEPMQLSHLQAHEG